MRCAAIARLLDELVDGTLDAARASAVRGHVRECRECARRLDETAALKQGLRGLEPIDPPASLWGRIQDELAAAETTDARRSRWWWWWQGARRELAWAGAGVVAVGLAVAVVVWRQGQEGTARDAVGEAIEEHLPPTPVAPETAPSPPSPPSPPPPASIDEALADLDRAEAEYRRAVRELEAVVAAEKPRWRPEAARAFDENLAAIDAAVERQREAFRERPGDVAALDALVASYRKQIDFLEEAVIRGGVEVTR
jgi:uncharacterized protein YukE